MIIVTTNGLIKGYTLTNNIKKFDLSQDAAAKEDSDKQLDLNRRKIDLQNKISKMMEKKQMLI